MTHNLPVLTFRKPHSGRDTARVTVSIGGANIGRIYPFDDGRAAWFLDLIHEQGTAKSVRAAEAAVADALGRWMELAGLVQS